ncbi:MAG: helix-hairpin-helix domain-containing protein [Desulfobacteraceae bacterium]|nr:helix-hairpin-helix domain-containing protein [Desulfobacteraceae bacterium]MBC2756493.1 helix-hairpin-helix domain-containing protein [Desulfobacteraceae bacterium]
MKLKRLIVLVTVIGFVLGFSGSVLAADGDGKINLNTATAEDLTQLKGVGEKIAESIVQYREENGLFKSVADLEQVKGIGPKILADNADLLTI